MSGKLAGLPGGIIVRRYSEPNPGRLVDDVDGKYIILMSTSHTGPEFGLFARTSEGIWVMDSPRLSLTPELAVGLAKDILDLYGDGGRR